VLIASWPRSAEVTIWIGLLARLVQERPAGDYRPTHSPLASYPFFPSPVKDSRRRAWTLGVLSPGDPLSGAEALLTHPGPTVSTIDLLVEGI
jgi:hypothetical protein